MSGQHMYAVAYRQQLVRQGTTDGAGCGYDEEFLHHPECLSSIVPRDRDTASSIDR